MTIELLQLVLLIIIANGAPIVIRVLLNNGFNLSVDFGCKLQDNNPIFGPSKTWRGISAALMTTPIAAWMIGYSFEIGFMIAVYAIVGDLLSSFIKRRLAMKPSSQAPLLDQVPESLFPAVMMMHVFKLEISSVILLVLLFINIEWLVSHVFYRWGLRKKPY